MRPVTITGVVEAHGIASTAAGTGGVAGRTGGGAGSRSGGAARWGAHGGYTRARDGEVSVSFLCQRADGHVVLVHDAVADLRGQLSDKQLLEEEPGVGLFRGGNEGQHLGEELGRTLVTQAGKLEQLRRARSL